MCSQLNIKANDKMELGQKRLFERVSTECWNSKGECGVEMGGVILCRSCRKRVLANHTQTIKISC